jgi:hypothetical protein
MKMDMLPEQGERQLRGLRVEVYRLLSKLKPIGIGERLSAQTAYNLHDIKDLIENIEELVENIEEE